MELAFLEVNMKVTVSLDQLSKTIEVEKYQITNGLEELSHKVQLLAGLAIQDLVIDLLKNELQKT